MKKYNLKANKCICFLMAIAIIFICTSCSQITNSVSQKSQNNKSKKISSKITAKNTNTFTVPKQSKTETVKKVIVIDPGHANRSNLQKEAIAPDSTVMKMIDGGGAEGIKTKTPEYVVNMKVAMKLKTLLEQRKYTVVMTKTSDSESPSNIQRAETGNNANADLEIRIHADSADDSSVSGASMLVPAAINSNTASIHERSKEYGTIILNSLINEVKMNNRGVIERSDLTGFNWSKVPVVLIEMGFLSNYNEDALLSTDDYQNKLANALADGISNAVKNTP